MTKIKIRKKESGQKIGYLKVQHYLQPVKSGLRKSQAPTVQ